MNEGEIKDEKLKKMITKPSKYGEKSSGASKIYNIWVIDFQR